MANVIDITVKKENGVFGVYLHIENEGLELFKACDTHGDAESDALSLSYCLGVPVFDYSKISQDIGLG